jgi:hypothetical protein
MAPQRTAVVSFVLAALFAAQAGAAPRAPAIDPPAVPQAAPVVPDAVHRQAAASGDLTLWTLHTSADGLHPNTDEQALLWLMNSARQEPASEGIFLANLDDAGVQSAISWFSVDLDVLLQEFALIEAKPPAAFDARLYEAAYQHSLYLIANDAQNHTGQFDRVDDAGFHAWGMRGNVFSYADTALYAHAGFNIDWGGNDGTGMQTGRGHRLAIMSIDGNYTNVGLAAVPEVDGATEVGPLVVTGNYAYAATSYPDHYNRFLVGTVWKDLDNNGRYDAGEGFGGVEVVPSAGPYYAVTGAAGGYAIPLPPSVTEGPVAVAFAGGGVEPETKLIELGSNSELVDYIVRDGVIVPEPGATTACAAALLGLLALQAKRAASRRRAKSIRLAVE